MPSSLRGPELAGSCSQGKLWGGGNWAKLTANLNKPGIGAGAIFNFIRHGLLKFVEMFVEVWLTKAAY